MPVLLSKVPGASPDAPWQGTIRLVAIHNSALTQEQVQQNFDVGVGEKFFLLFDVSDVLQVAPQSSYFLFEVQQFDSYSYLFDRPHFLTLDGSSPTGIPVQGMRIGLNGDEAPVGQSYANLNTTLEAGLFEELGQPLSPLGAVLPLEKGPQEDEFFLTFDLRPRPGFAGHRLADGSRCAVRRWYAHVRRDQRDVCRGYGSRSEPD